MANDESWNRIWERVKKTTKVKSRNIRSDDDFADLHWTADEIVGQYISDALTEATMEIDEAPQPGLGYRTGAALENYSEKVNRGHKGKRIFAGIIGGLALGAYATANSENPNSLAAIGTRLGGIAGGGLATTSDYFVSKSMEKTGERIKGSDADMQQVSSEGSYPSIITNKLSGRESSVYGFKAFREDGLEWTELPDGEDIEKFLRDMNVEAKTDWKVKRKSSHPLQVVGIKATYDEQHDASYDRRNRIAQEIAEEENISVDEVLDVGGYGEDSVPTEPDHREGEETYEFIIVDTNPKHSFDIEEDFMDYSELVAT